MASLLSTSASATYSSSDDTSGDVEPRGHWGGSVSPVARDIQLPSRESNLKNTMEAVMLGMDANFEYSATTPKKLDGHRFPLIAHRGLVHERENDFVLQPVVVDLFALFAEGKEWGERCPLPVIKVSELKLTPTGFEASQFVADIAMSPHTPISRRRSSSDKRKVCVANPCLEKFDDRFRLPNENKNGKDFTICLQSWVHDIISSLGGFRTYLVGQSVNGILQVYFPKCLLSFLATICSGRRTASMSRAKKPWPP